MNIDIISSMLAVFWRQYNRVMVRNSIRFFLDLNPILIFIISAAGSILSVYIVIILGDDIRKKLIKWRYREQSTKKGKIYNIWNKYGIIGLGLLSPLLFGAPLGAAIVIGLNMSQYRLLL